MRRALWMMLVAMWCTLPALLPGTALAGAEVAKVEPVRDLTTLNIEELMQIEVGTVYSASKFEQKVTEAPASVSIVTGSEIRKYGYRTLADILRSIRSFNITYDRNYSYAGVRGFSRAGDYNTRILLLVDGHRLNDNIYDGAPLGSDFVVDVDLIERVEVVRGPGSSLYGNNAFFAVVNVITRPGLGLAGAELSGEAGSFDTYKGRLSYGESFPGGVETLLSGSISASQGQRLFFPEFATPDNNNGYTDHTDDDKSYSTLAKLAYRDFSLETVYSSRTKGIPTASYTTDFNDPRNQTRDAWWLVDLKYAHELKDRAEVTGRLFYDDYDYQGRYIYAGVMNKDRGSGRWWGGELRVATTPFARHRLVAGTEFRDNLRQEQKNFDADPFTLYLDDRRKSRTWAGYVQDEFTILPNLILNVGARYDHFSTFGNNANPRLALICTPLEKTTFKLLYGSAFRAPNVYELFYDDGNSLKANPQLKAEKIRTYELIWEQYVGSRLRGTVAGFYYTIDDLISQVTDPLDDKQVFRNIDRAEAKGVEAEVEGRWGNGVEGRISYSFQDARDGASGETLVGSPRHLAKLNLILPLVRKELFAGIEEQFTSRRKTLTGDHAESFYLTNLTLFSKNILKNLDLFASVYNLFDRRYGDPAGPEHLQDVIEQDGRVFRMKLTGRF